jgi:type I restriction enzyme S subunit
MLKFRWETEFKETEIGEIPKDWEIRKLGDIAEITTGGTPRRNNPLYWNGNINWLKSQEVADNYIYDTEEKITELGQKNSNAKKIYPPGTLIIALYASPTAGRVALLRTFSTINQALAAIVGENNRFLFFSLIGNRERLLLSASGAAQQNLNLQIVKDFEIPLPPLPEQSHIATVLSYFDDLIENKKRQNEILEKTAMAIFKSWFIDFEPFRNEEFVYNEELGKEMPKGWEVKRLGEVIKIESGGSAPQKEEYFIGGKNPFVRVKHLTNYPCVEEADFITDEAVKQHNLKLYNEGSIIFQRSGESIAFGRVNILPFDAYIVNHLAAIPNLPSNKLLMEFLLFTLKNILIEAIEERSGTALPYIRVSDIENKKIPIPPPHILQSFHSLVEPLFEKIILNQKQIMTLRKIRDTLLPLLVFGKLRIEEV